MLRTYHQQYDFADGHEQWEAKIRQQAEERG